MSVFLLVMFVCDSNLKDLLRLQSKGGAFLWMVMMLFLREWRLWVENLLVAGPLQATLSLMMWKGQGFEMNWRWFSMVGAWLQEPALNLVWTAWAMEWELLSRTFWANQNGFVWLQDSGVCLEALPWWLIKPSKPKQNAIYGSLWLMMILSSGSHFFRTFGNTHFDKPTMWISHHLPIRLDQLRQNGKQRAILLVASCALLVIMRKALTRCILN